jgi:ankyrin repeat protein
MSDSDRNLGAAVLLAAESSDARALRRIFAEIDEDEAVIDAVLSYRSAAGSSAVHRAVSGYSFAPECLELLLATGFDASAVNSAGSTPLHQAAGFGRVDAVRLLIQAGSDVHCRNDNGETATELAEKLERAEDDVDGPYAQTAGFLRSLEGETYVKAKR